MFSFFKKTISNIFIQANDKKHLDIGDGEVDYILSRSLYACIPTDDFVYSNYAMGNYCIKPYIDTLAGYISTPHIVANDEECATYINNFIAKNKATLIKLYRQAMIDGLVYIRFQIEKNNLGRLQPAIKIIPRENVAINECIKGRDGNFEKFVIVQKKEWKEQNNEIENVRKCTIKTILLANLEIIEIDGDLPLGFQSKKEEWQTSFSFIPIFAFYNNKLSFLNDGLPECASLLPYIKKYNTVFQNLDNHLHHILDPKLKLKLKSSTNFLKNTMGIREKDYAAIEKGEYKPDITQFKVAILQDKDEDAAFINQQDNIKSAIEVLNLIHWIIIELTMPEYLYGTALGTTNASVKEQSPVWIKKIEGRQAEYSDFYYWLSECLYTCANSIEGRNVYKDIFSSSGFINVEWEEIEGKDDVALMEALKTFTESIVKLMQEGLISPETAFNTLKNYISIPNDWENEHEKSIKYLLEKIEITNRKSDIS